MLKSKGKANKCYRKTKSGEFTIPVPVECMRKCGSKQKVKKTKPKQKPKPITILDEEGEPRRKCCGCPVDENYDEDDDDCVSHSSDCKLKAFYITSNSSLRTISDIDSYVETTKSKKSSCPCGSKTFLLKDLTVCDCRFSTTSIPKGQKPCPLAEQVYSNSSFQVSESIVEPLVRYAKTQTSFILSDDDDFQKRQDEFSPKQIQRAYQEGEDLGGCVDNCPDFEPRPQLCKEEEDDKSISDCGANDLSPKPSNDYFIFWDRTKLTPEQMCPPKPKYQPEKKKTLKPEPNLDHLNECELLQYYKNQIKKTGKTKLKRKKASRSDAQMLQNWCPLAFKLPEPEPRPPRRRKKRSSKNLQTELEKNCLLDPLFNLKVLTDPRIKEEACYKRCLVPEDCEGYEMRPEDNPADEEYDCTQLNMRNNSNFQFNP